MNRSAQPPRVSVVIPLYRSKRFLSSITANIDAMPDSDVEIIVSDRHCYDDSIDILAERYSADSRVRCLKRTDKLDWVQHLNELIKESQGVYWRFLAHDDLSPAGSLEALIAVLDSRSDLILAYGPITAIDWAGERLPARDRTRPIPDMRGREWDLDLSLSLFWCGYFSGAFKGLIRRAAILDNGLFIRGTRDQIYPERCWLFALSLVGPFQFVPEAKYLKRFYADSTHAQWRISSRNVYSAAWVMSGYAWDLLSPGAVRLYAVLDIWYNARALGKWFSGLKTGMRPAYRPYPVWLARRRTKLSRRVSGRKL